MVGLDRREGEFLVPTRASIVVAGEFLVPARASVVVAGEPHGCRRDDEAGLIALVAMERALAWTAARASALVIIAVGARRWWSGSSRG